MEYPLSIFSFHISSYPPHMYLINWGIHTVHVLRFVEHV